jgi:hypothetical protein
VVVVVVVVVAVAADPLLDYSLFNFHTTRVFNNLMDLESTLSHIE